jgi:CRP-like cAMP-binding protein
LTQEQIAELAGTSRATVNRVLREDSGRGLVELGRGHITVHGDVGAPGAARRW